MGSLLRRHVLVENQTLSSLHKLPPITEEEGDRIDTFFMEAAAESIISRPPPPQQAPWLVFFSHGKKQKNQTFYSLLDRKPYLKNIPELRKKCCMVCSHGWLLMVGCNSDWFLWNPVSMEKIQLPSPPSELRLYCVCILTSSPKNPDSVLLVFERSKQSYMFCHPGDDKWVHKQIYFRGENYRADTGVWSLAVCNGTLYAWTDDDDLVVMDIVPYPKVRVIIPDQLPPLLRIYPRDFHALVESCGQLFGVIKSYGGNSMEVIRFSVLRMDFSSHEWLIVHSIGDMAFFLCWESCLSCRAGDGESSGVKANCIYYVENDDPYFYRYDLEDGSITIELPSPRLSTPWDEPQWILPIP